MEQLGLGKWYRFSFSLLLCRCRRADFHGDVEDVQGILTASELEDGERYFWKIGSSVLTGGAEKYFWIIGSDWLDEVLAGGQEELLLEDCLDVRFFSMAPPF